jgi:hypothetical protein
LFQTYQEIKNISTIKREFEGIYAFSLESCVEMIMALE